jgi:hypothetical protein
MMPEFLAEIPSDLQENWFCIPYPTGILTTTKNKQTNDNRAY